MDKRHKITLNIPACHRKRLKEWAAIKGVTPTTLAGSILANRIEVNEDQIMGMVKSRAEDEGLTVEEFIKSIVDNESEE
jgi:predicted DNA binding CopG/RHH family protein